MPTSQKAKPSLEEIFDRLGASESLFADDMHTLRRSRVSMDDATDSEFRALLSPPASLLDRLGDLKTSLALLLVEKAYPNPLDKILVDGQDWRPLPKGWDETPTEARWRKFVRPGESITPGFAHIEEHALPLSDAWFAARLVRLIVGFEHAKPRSQTTIAYDIGHLVATWRSRAVYKYVSAGRRVRKAASESGTQRSLRFLPERRRILQEMRRLIADGHSVSRAADLAAFRGFGTSEDANRRTWYRYRKEL